MVFVDPKNLGYEPYWQKWLQSHEAKHMKDSLGTFYKKYVPGSISLILEGIMDGKQGEKLNTIVRVTNVNLVGAFALL